jgi:putative ATP-binding cassette transporter
MAAISGIANGLLLAIINKAAENVSNQTIENHLFMVYLTAFILYLYAQKYALSQAVTAIEQVIRKVRLRITHKIRSSELLFIENVGRAEMYTRLTQDSNLVSQSALILVFAAQSSIVLFFSLIYIALLSPISFLIVLMDIAIGLLFFFSISRELRHKLELAAQKEAEFFNSLNHVLDGFKEIKINQEKSNTLFNHIVDISTTTEQLKVDAGMQMMKVLSFSQMAFYILLALLVFIMPLFGQAYPDMIFKLTSATLFIIGPMGTVVSSLPSFSRANVAISNIYQLESELDMAAPKVQTTAQSVLPQDFKTIRFKQATFHYHDKLGKPLFAVGPIDLTVNKGEILFIVGGNGSGKSTLLKMLISLYPPITGKLYLDEEEIDEFNSHEYRELFAIIFTDFHLFDKLYGLSNIDDKRMKALLRLMQLDKKTKYLQGKFTNINLSTGQKKRLAFIVAVLENKPIYIFDEWAADQDPQFRKYFYEVLLEDLRKQGKTIIAVTHDDKYFHTADRVLKMEYGQLIEYEEHTVG